ncbi:endonuclease domain-containing protein [Devosia sp. PTR5]|uniref:Endonuclease domain-containing protein n=1 Tax=Devosia oryzisoli TaxID=2774138 RepID=A0A927FQ04_9HYPH|nr:DUF559 domain-containing protein [Devosia oryzisoli]MBD8064120.1 endonuclease domain-containing protein [Devosia oryzisoli]
MAKELARKLRRQASYAEQDFWRLTWTFRQSGWPFRRQQLIGSYYVDFACIKAKLVVEIDGDTHGTDLAQSNDAVRDDYLRARGFTVLRFSNHDVTTNLEGIFDVLRAHLDIRAPSPPPQPSPQGGGSRAGEFDETVLQAGSDPLPLVGRPPRANTDEDHK